MGSFLLADHAGQSTQDGPVTIVEFGDDGRMAEAVESGFLPRDTARVDRISGIGRTDTRASNGNFPLYLLRQRAF